MAQICALLFDLDNTLVDFMKMKQQAVDAAVLSMIDSGLDVPPAEAKRRVWAIYEQEGIEFQEVFDHFLKDHYGVINFKMLAAGIIAYRRAREAAMVVYPHVRSTLIELMRRGYRLAVISDAPAKQAWLRLCALEIHHFFEAVITFEDTGVRKPDPRPFKMVMQAMGIQPDQALMIGDWPERDMVGAKAVGLRTVFARYGDAFHVTHSGADRDIDDIQEILELLEDPEFNR
ncbi:MAG: HAD-IIIA family hydrolase [Candidatus Zixiibacteriota bacterium]|nr:MAG: HAD-IIIA family hydrolase [candidate division Zixibacteria bacterium]